MQDSKTRFGGSFFHTQHRHGECKGLFEIVVQQKMRGMLARNPSERREERSWRDPEDGPVFDPDIPLQDTAPLEMGNHTGDQAEER